MNRSRRCSPWRWRIWQVLARYRPPAARRHRREKVNALLWRCRRGVGLADMRYLVLVTTKVQVPGVLDVVVLASMMYVPAVIT